MTTMAAFKNEPRGSLLSILTTPPFSLTLYFHQPFILTNPLFSPTLHSYQSSISTNSTPNSFTHRKNHSRTRETYPWTSGVMSWQTRPNHPQSLQAHAQRKMTQENKTDGSPHARTITELELRKITKPLKQPWTPPLPPRSFSYF